MDNTIQAHQKELCNKLWAMANALRGNMEAYEFKNYILGMIFYYYLSDKTEKYMVNLLKDDGIGYEEAWADPEYKEAVVEKALRDLGFVIEPQFLFRKMVKMVENRSFDIEFLQKAINSLMESTIGNDSQEDFDGLFSDMQLDSTKLGHTVKDRSAVMSKIISSLDEINFGVEDTKIDVLGNAYEYLIGQFAATAGKKAGEFYTPSGPAELLCRIACLGLSNVKDAADPTCGSGSLLLRLKNYANVRNYYVKPLGSIVQINPKTGLLPEAFIYIDLECVEAGVLHSRKLISRNSAPSRAQRVLREGDLIYQMVRPYQKNNYYFQKAFEYPTVASTGYAQIRCSEANTQFIYEQLSSDYFAREAMLRSTGTGYPAINADDLAEIPIWVPPFERQQKVGAVLSFIGAKIEANQRMLSALCRVKSSLLQQLFI